MSTIPLHLELHGKLIDLKPTKETDYLTLQKILSNPKIMHIDLLHKKAEYGIILHHPYWNTGISLEGTLLCLDYAFANLQLHRITFETFTTNERAEFFLKKLGAQLECIQKESFFEGGRFQDNAVYVLFERQWPDAKQKLQEKLGRQCTEVR